MEESDAARLRAAQHRFVAEWGALGSAWGINRSMAAIHARLLVSSQPLCTDDLMADLDLSRGNTSTNVRELVGWGLVRPVLIQGERKQFFAAEKDPWKIFGTIVRERLRRELDPALGTLTDVAAMTEGIEGEEADEFNRVVGGLAAFIKRVRSLALRVTDNESTVLKSLGRFLA
jgi:DNA-binding transcriptional regulator GbsR (MarR family)